MRKFFYALAFTASLLGSCADNSPGRIEILFLGHDSEHHNSEKFAPMLAVPLFQKGINLTYTADLNDLTPENLEKYDGLMIYANHEEIAPEQEQAMKEFVEGGKALIPIHSASFCFQNSDWYVKTVGGQFKSHRTDTFVAKAINVEHPVMKGLEEFETWDETYVHSKINPDINILMERVEGEHHEPWTWVRKEGEGRVFYTAYGHDERTWGHPGFHELVANGVLWAVNDEAKERLARLELPTPTFEEADIPNYEKRDPAPRYQHPLSAEESQKLVQVPVDFELQLFASEPDIINPIAMTWDEKGRLWVIETVDYPNEVRTDDGIGNDRIKICEDTDNDGKADKFTVFADGLNIPTSLTFANGGLIVSMAPHFLFLKDTDGDDKADIRKKIISGWGKGDTHAGPSNLKYGLDNKIWGVLGYSGFKGKVGDKNLSFSQGVYRFDPNGENLEYLGRTTNNTWGLGFSEEFDVFISTANGLHSAFFAMPNKYVKRAVIGGSGNTVHRIETHYDMPHVTPYLRQVDWHGGYTAAAGHNLYTARNYPKSYWNRVGFVCEPTGRVLHKAVLTPTGAGYTEKNGFNLLASSDEWFAPVHAEVGPDGAVWVADWYNFIIQHNPTPRGFDNGEGNAYVNPWRDSQHGRIYRVVYKEAESYSPVQLDRNDLDGLLAALENDNMFWRTTAQRLIVETQNKEAIPRLFQLINDRSVDEIGLNSPAVHALWTLHGLGTLDGSNDDAVQVVTNALSHPAAGVRQNAVKVLPKNEKTLESILKADLINDPNLKTRMAALLVSADCPASSKLGKELYEASQLPNNATDEYLPQAFFAAVLAHQKSFMDAVPNNLSLDKPDSTMNLTERIVKSFRQEQYKLDRWRPVLFPPDVTGKEISITLKMAPSNDGLEGTAVAQGDKDAGYSLYIKGNKLHWEVRQNGKAYKVVSKKPLPNDKFTVVARLTDGGKISMEVDGRSWGKGKAPSLFNKPFDSEDVRIGYAYEDQGERVWFKGHIDRDGVLELKAPGNASLAQEVKSEGERSAANKPSAGAVTINLKVIEHQMKFDKQTFTVEAGQRVTINFTNPDFMQHNLLVAKPGSLKKIGAAADVLARDPKGAEQHYVPKMPEVIVATRLVDPEGRETLVFTVPEEPGDYPFVCTVPGHWRTMNGIMKVVRSDQKSI